MSRMDVCRQAERFLERFEELEPAVRAFIEEPDRAGRIDREVKRLASAERHEPVSPLHGMPVGVKDMFHVDGLPTRAGTDVPPAVLTAPEGSFIRKLRARGAWVAGKTTTEALAYAGPFPTRNPLNPAHTPGGSSAGSAAAVAAGMVPLAVGTQTMRSVIAPASFCGIVGFKPSYGRVPLDGVIRLAPSWDTIGLFTPDIVSMKAAAEALVPDWTPAAAERRPVLGIPEGIYMTLMHDETKAAFLALTDKLKDAGYSIKSVRMPWEDAFIYGDDMLRFVQGEMAETHAGWLPEWLDRCGSAVRHGCEAGRSLDPASLHRYRAGQRKLRNDLREAGCRAGVDLWISPAQGGSAPLLGGPSGWPGMTAVWSYAGCPAVTIPLMSVNGLPLGLQCIGDYRRDEALIADAERIWTAIAPNIT